jgi:hypothetical protein
MTIAVDRVHTVCNVPDSRLDEASFSAPECTVGVSKGFYVIVNRPVVWTHHWIHNICEQVETWATLLLCLNRQELHVVKQSFENMTTVQISSNFPNSCIALSCSLHISHDLWRAECPIHLVPCYFILLVQATRHLVFWPTSYPSVTSFLIGRSILLNGLLWSTHKTTTVLNHNNHILFPYATNYSIMQVSFLSCPRAPQLYGIGSLHPTRYSVIAVVLRARLR